MGLRDKAKKNLNRVTQAQGKKDRRITDTPEPEVIFQPTAAIETPAEKPQIENVVGVAAEMPAEIPAIEDAQPAKPVKVERSDSAPRSRSSLYNDAFQSIGATTRRRYESGKLLRLHRALFDEIKAEIGDQDAAPVNLSPIQERLDISRFMSIKILSCLEHYGYLHIEWNGGSPGGGRTRIFRIMRDIEE